jgi:hypothetical protein
MLTPGFNRWGQMRLHFGTSFASTIQRDAGLITCDIGPSSMREVLRETGLGSRLLGRRQVAMRCKKPTCSIGAEVGNVNLGGGLAVIPL